MKLHRDKFSFLNIIELIHDVTGIREDILEKDYYVTLLLKELSEKQGSLPAYFKGGTALYKAQKSIRRFSEDIDLTICIDNCSGSQAKKRLETATKKYLSLPRTSRKELEDDRKGSITAVYDYTPAVTVDVNDPLQRFGYVKVEGTSFTVSEPFSTLEIEPIIYTYATEEQKSILREQFEVMPFPIKTIRLERIFADKIFAAEFYYERAMYFDVAKHFRCSSFTVCSLLELMKWVGIMETKEFGRRINMVRKDRGFTANKLSELCNINATYLRQIEGGAKVPSLPVFITICNALKISPDYLLRDALKDNEVSKIRELTELWESTSPSQQKIAVAMIRAVLENKDY